MKRYLFESTIKEFCSRMPEEIHGILTSANEFNNDKNQNDSWRDQIIILQEQLNKIEGYIFFEFSIPRMGKRIDVLLICQHVIFILEFKVGESNFLSSAVDQVWDYALDLKHFHATSHEKLILPVLIATKAEHQDITLELTSHNDNLFFPVKTNAKGIRNLIELGLQQSSTNGNINVEHWKDGSYAPTPTIIEAATALFKGHSVADITRSDAAADNIKTTSQSLSKIIASAKTDSKKAICFVTGVPGAGKTLVGLDIATQHLNKDAGMTSVFLSGNGPLVAVLREALTRDKVNTEKALGRKVKKGAVMSEVKAFIQNVHHYRDLYLSDPTEPFDHVAIFDEAQRAWNLEQTINFMTRKKGKRDFQMSEPEFLISCLDRHKDWCVIICLVGGGQEINTGEGGISEWINAMNRSYRNWHIHVSNKLLDNEYAAGAALRMLKEHEFVEYSPELHLDVSLRSFRTENLSFLVKSLLDIEVEQAQLTYAKLKDKYPIVLTRDLNKAKKWIRQQARGTERYGIVVSSQAYRLKPHAIDVKTPIDPIHWFLDDKKDVRSSYYLEDVATEFQVQGLELDWSCVTWDGDFRYNDNSWEHCSFVGSKWQKIKKTERKTYQKNAYRVLLTRARQGMIIVVPEGSDEDQTRKREFYDSTFNYLASIGFEQI